MKVGSLVELVSDSNWANFERFKSLGIIYPIKGNIYTIRNFQKGKMEIGIRLEEINNPIVHFTHINANLEPSFNIIRFRELQTPSSISIESFITETV